MARVPSPWTYNFGDGMYSQAQYSPKDGVKLTLAQHRP